MGFYKKSMNNGLIIQRIYYKKVFKENPFYEGVQPAILVLHFDIQGTGQKSHCVNIPRILRKIKNRKNKIVALYKTIQRHHDNVFLTMAILMNIKINSSDRNCHFLKLFFFKNNVD